jgi:hypothetical protein
MRVKMEAGYIEALRHILGEEALARVQMQIELKPEAGAHMVAEDAAGRAYDYSSEGFPPDTREPSAEEWLGVEPLPGGW